MSSESNVANNEALVVDTHAEPLDLIGGPFAVIESDPDVFTILARKLGIRGVEFIEMYDIEPWAVSHLDPLGLIFCFLWRKDAHRPGDFQDPAAERVWFANQLLDDACASQAILNVCLNLPEIDIGDELNSFRVETQAMSAVMKGLSISNSPLIRHAHNSLARPADIRGALNAIATTSLKSAKPAKKTGTSLPPTKRRKYNNSSSPPKPSRSLTKESASDDIVDQEAYHFIGYVPAHGKVWELDGLKSGPLEVGELSTTDSWMDVARPALRMKMQKYSGDDESNIRFSLLALVKDQYHTASDDLEMLKRKKGALERRMGDEYPDGWSHLIDSETRAAAAETFATSVQPAANGKIFSPDFGARKLDMELAILDLPRRNLVEAWKGCIQDAMPAKISAEDEIAKSIRGQTDHIKRTYDYEAFLREFVTCLHNEGHLNLLLGRHDDEKTMSVGKSKAT